MPRPPPVFGALAPEHERYAAWCSFHQDEKNRETPEERRRRLLGRK